MPLPSDFLPEPAAQLRRGRGGIGQALARWRARAAEREAAERLRALPDPLLSDMGLTRDAVRARCPWG
jgi:uncharacterized protein YjiS (DUF1127 family)